MTRRAMDRMAGLARWGRGVALAALIVAAPAQAADAVLDAPGAGVSVSTNANDADTAHARLLGASARLLREPPGPPLMLDEAHDRLAAGAFTPSTSTIPTLGSRAAPLWLHLGLDNRTGGAQAYRIYLMEGWGDRVDAWVVRDGATLRHWAAGDERSPGRGLRPGLGFAFDAVLPPGRSELFVRGQGISSAAFPLRVVPIADTAGLEAGTRHWLGIVQGFLLALVTGFGLLWLVLRERALLRYVAYVASYLYMHLAYSGVAALSVWPDAPPVARYAVLVGMVLFASTGLWFARGFLAIARWAPRVDRAVAWLVGLALAGMAACVMADATDAAVMFAFNYIVLFTLIMVALGVAGVRHGQRQARPFLGASLLSMAGAFTTTLAVMGHLPFNALTFRAMEIGVMAEATIWALALALRLRRDREHTALALQLAERDPLTGLLNRRGFRDRAAELREAARRSGTPLALLVVDIDHFKALNDAHGHDAGDRALAAVAERLRAVARRNDVLARWGGEEFLFLLSGMDADAATPFAERVRLSLSERAIVLEDGQCVSLTASIGVACLPPATSIEELIREADGALFAAKQAGRDRVWRARREATQAV